MDLTQLYESDQKLKIHQARQDYETRRLFRFILTMLALMVSLLGLFSLVGLISHAALVKFPDDPGSTWTENAGMAILQSGPGVTAIFTGISMVLWGLRLKYKYQ